MPTLTDRNINSFPSSLRTLSPAASTAMTDGAALPPMLSPTLPDEWDLPAPLSPTLPEEYAGNSTLSAPKPARPLSKSSREARPLSREPSLRADTPSQIPGSGTPVPEESTQKGHASKKPRTSSASSISTTSNGRDSSESRPLKKQDRKDSKGQSTASTADKPRPRLLVVLRYKPQKPKPRPAVNRDYSSSESEKEKESTKTSATKKEPAPPQGPPQEVPPEFRALRAEMHAWVDRARDRKHESDAAASSRKHRRAAVLGLDSVICFIRAFLCEDRADKMLHKHPHVRSWATLVPYLSKMSNYLESVDADIAGVCYQVSAVLNVHISRVSRSSSVDPGKSALRSLSDFRRGLSLLPFKSLKDRYNLTWDQSVLNPTICDPINDRATLPLHANSNLQEAAAFAYNMGREWTHQESIDYTWSSVEPLDIPGSSGTEKSPPTNGNSRRRSS